MLCNQIEHDENIEWNKTIVLQSLDFEKVYSSPTCKINNHVEIIKTDSAQRSSNKCKK